MEIRKIKNASLIALLILFNFSFWQESWGINLILFGWSLIGILFFLNKKRIQLSSKHSLLLIGVLISTITVLVNNSDLAIFSFIISAILLMASFIQGTYQSLYYLGLAFVLNLFKNKPQLAKSSTEKQIQIKKYQWLKISLIPIGFTFLFYYLYKFANPAFNEWTIIFWNGVWDYWAQLFHNYPLTRFAFIAISGLLIGSIVWANPIKFLLQKDESQLNVLQRDTQSKTHSVVGQLYKMPKSKGLGMHLITEYRIALMTFASLNILLLIFNISDILHVWLGQSYGVGKVHYASMLHNGTNILIFTILLSVSIVLYHFRANLNFLKKRKLLKQLAMLWLVQNLFLASGVIIRAMRYVEHYGLTYKRIGVFVFSLLVIGGLVTVILKIKGSKTSYYLFRQNFAYAYCLIVLLSVFNWDVSIAKYNIAHQGNHSLDTSFLLTLNDRSLFVLKENEHLFKGNYHSFMNRKYRGMSQKQVLHQKIDNYLKKETKHSFWSWNLGDQKCKQSLTKQMNHHEKSI